MKHFEERMPADKLDNLIEILKSDGFEIIGPQIKDQVIVYEPLTSKESLPQGYRESQEKGYYRLIRREDKAYFGYTLGPDSWKKYLFSPRERLWKSRKTSQGRVEFIGEDTEEKPQAFLGLRACELAAIRTQDQIFLEGPAVDKSYKKRREKAFLIAVQCMAVAPTCFCASMNTGPEVSQGFDLLLVEIPEQNDHRFLLKSASDRGKKVLSQLRDQKCLEPSSEKDLKISMQQVTDVREGQVRKMNPPKDKEVLEKSFDSSHWDEIAKRCLNCANCTMVCPTCFCSRVEDSTDLKGENAERWRQWDSCFNLDHSYIHGGNVRQSGKSRYRQWLSHKIASWVDQFGESGCVGCGRCIAWCPVGIDLTEEVKVFTNENNSGFN